ncbi:MAG: hypothetical protein E3J86_05330 [Candidatus Thorarchaeota archaeon]|nr:MAG: hypothetical protein E3J86_05330 [Candidatus Thorarchaeota archaeon]
MEFEDISEFSSETSAGTIKIRIMDLSNGQLVLITDSDRFRLGFSAVAIPAGQGRSEPTSTGLFTEGLEITLVRTLAERVASWTNQTCMLVLGMSALTRERMMELTSLLKDHLVS